MKRSLSVLPLVSLIALSACVYVQESHVRDKGSTVSQQTVAQVEPGKTTKDWVLSNLGTPDRIQADKDGLEVYEYISERRERTERKFIFLFSVEADKIVARKVTRVMMRNGVVESVSTSDV